MLSIRNCNPLHHIGSSSGDHFWNFLPYEWCIKNRIKVNATSKSYNYLRLVYPVDFKFWSCLIKLVRIFVLQLISLMDNNNYIKQTLAYIDDLKYLRNIIISQVQMYLLINAYSYTLSGLPAVIVGSSVGPFFSIYLNPMTYVYIIVLLKLVC